MDEIYKEVEELIQFIKDEMRKMNLDAEEVFLNGNCGNLYRIFVEKFPKYTTPFLITYRGEPFHIVTKIGDRLYDITGETNLDKYADIFIASENGKTRVPYKKEKFAIEQISLTHDVIRNRKMCNMYKYDDRYDQSIIDGDMEKLLKKIKQRDEETR